MSDSKVQLGQFYTINNPFNHPLFYEWLSLIPSLPSATVVEPFAGANNLIKLVGEATPLIKEEQWQAFDIEPEAIEENCVPSVKVVKRDTILSPPAADVMITNPPYLAKNSATRMGMDVNFHGYQDLYEVAVDSMLRSARFVAAIIPESFLTRKLFKDRLYGFISLTHAMFDDTEFPVGLALWVASPTADYKVYSGDKYLGNYKEVLGRTSLLSVKPVQGLEISYNKPTGILGLYAVDNQVGASIRFVRGDSIPADTIKVSSRAITRIDLVYNNMTVDVDSINLDEFIGWLNSELLTYRRESFDLFLTAFKGLRRDGLYRRRLDWRTCSLIIHTCFNQLVASL